MFPELYLTVTDPRRRRLVASLHETDAETGLALPAHVATERGDPESVMAELDSVHLPFLEEVGYVDWYTDRGRVVRGPRFTELEPFLATAEQTEQQRAVSWPI